MHDLVVVGGGPAGLAVALGAAQVGLGVVVLDRRAGVVDKACGEGLMPGALAALQSLGVDPTGHPIRGITYRQGDTVAQAAFRRGPGRGVRRTTLHDAMRDAAAAAGITVREATVAGVEQHADHVTVAGVEARYAVAADGLHSTLRTAIGLDVRDTAMPRWGLRRHFSIAPWTDRVEVTWGRRSEAYVTPVSDDTVGVAILSGQRGGFDEHLGEFPELAARLADACPASTVRGAGPLRQRTGGLVAGRVLLVGDAAGYIDALTGEGLALSFAAAEQVVQCVARDRPEDYPRAWARVSRRSRWLTAGLLRARTTPATASRVVPAAARVPWLFTRAVDQLSR